MTEAPKFPYAVFTVCNLAYLPKALALAESLHTHQGTHLRIYVFDRRSELGELPSCAELYWIEEQGIPDFLELAFQYDIIELSTSLKPYLTLKLLESHDRVIFLDPDTYLYSPLTPILRDLDDHPIVLTPHHLLPQPDHPTESDLPMMRFGSFNLGFYAVKASEEAYSFLQWWSRRCIDHCFMESQFGLSTDQKWVTIAPALFTGIHISRDPGYNAAAWNTFEREITKSESGAYIVNGQHPLVFFHFSNFDPSDPEYLNKRASCEQGARKPTILEMALGYNQVLLKMKNLVGSRPYTYNSMSNGAYISPTLRRAYAAVRKELPPGHDPFDASGPVGHFAKKNYLFELSAKQFSPKGIRDKVEHSTIFSTIYAIMRFTLRIVGPNRFFHLTKLMVYLSMLSKNRELWKI